MGYSCTAKAGKVFDAINNVSYAKTGLNNGLPGGGLYEIGREQTDGAITGVVYKPYPGKPGYVIKAGSFRIEPNGHIARFPCLQLLGTKAEFENLGKLAYEKIFAT